MPLSTWFSVLYFSAMANHSETMEIQKALWDSMIYVVYHNLYCVIVVHLQCMHALGHVHARITFPAGWSIQWKSCLFIMRGRDGIGCIKAVATRIVSSAQHHAQLNYIPIPATRFWKRSRIITLKRKYRSIYVRRKDLLVLQKAVDATFPTDIRVIDDELDMLTLHNSSSNETYDSHFLHIHNLLKFYFTDTRNANNIEFLLIFSSIRTGISFVEWTDYLSFSFKIIYQEVLHCVVCFVWQHYMKKG